MKITNPITLDVARSNSYICLLGKQFDSNSRYLQVTLTNNGQPLPIPSGAGVVLRATRADGAGSMTAGTVNGDGTALVEIDETVLEVAGAASLSIEVTSGGQVLTSASCNLTVQKADASGWVKVYVAAASVSAGTYYITLAGQSYSFTTTQAIPAGGAIYFNTDGGTAQTRDASGNVLDASLTLTAGTSGTELTSDVPTMTFLAALAQQVGELADADNAVAGSAEALLGGGTAENVAVALRGNAGNARERIGKLIGGTIAWNQQHQKVSEETFIPSGNSNTTYTKTGEVLHISVNGNNTAKYAALSVTRITALIQHSVGHKFLIGFKFVATSGYDAYVAFNTGGRVYGGTPNNNYFTIAEAANNSVMQIGTNPNVVMTTSDYVEVTDIMCFDLTLLFGSTIADYVYTLESGTAGAGVAWIARYFPKILGGYYAYAAPALQSVNVEGKKISGFNLWDEEWELGSISASTGENEDVNSTWRTTNYIPLVPNTLYYVYAVTDKNLRARFYDAQKNYIGYNSGSGTTVRSTTPFTPPANAAYMRLAPAISDVPTPNHDICINISNPLLNGQYFPHREFYYPIQSGELRGVPKLDANNNLTFDGDWQEPDGTRTRRYGVIDLGSLDWVKYDTAQGTLFRSYAITGANIPVNSVNCKCAPYVNVSSTDRAEKTLSFAYADRADIIDSSYADAGAFKTAMNGVKLIFPLATPTTEAGQPFTAVERLDNGIEEVVDAGVEAGTRDVVVPVGQDATIYRDLAALLGAIPNPPTSAGTYTLRATVTTTNATFSWS